MFYIAKKDLDIHYSVNVQVGYLFSGFGLLQINELARDIIARDHLLELLISSLTYKIMSPSFLKLSNHHELPVLARPQMRQEDGQWNECRILTIED